MGCKQVFLCNTKVFLNFAALPGKHGALKKGGVMKEEGLTKLKLLIAEFLEALRMENYSQRTEGNYRSQLKFFIEYLESLPLEDLNQIDRETLHQYQLCLYGQEKKGKPLTMETQYARLVPVKAFFRWLVKSGCFLYDPAAGLQFPRIKKNLPRGIMSKKEINRVLSQPDPESPLGLRDKAILELLYSTGIRNAELRNLTIFDANIGHGELRINQGKGKKDRVVPIGEIAGQYLKTYLNNSRPRLVKDRQENNRLFVSINGQPLTGACLVWLVVKYVRKAGIDRRITPHAFRHTCATHMLKGRSNLRYIQELLGHGSIATTQIYTKVEVGDLKKEHKRCHPREKNL